jgi:hypothetical protein
MISKKYFKDYLRKLFPLAGLCLAVVILIQLIVFSSGSLSFGRVADPKILPIFICGFLVASFLPSVVFDYRFSKRKEDIFYSLPISRKSLAMTRFWAGALVLFVVYTLPALLGFLIALLSRSPYLTYVNYLPFYFTSVIFLFLVYAGSSFFALFAQSFSDSLESLFIFHLAAFFLPYGLAVLFAGDRSSLFWGLSPVGGMVLLFSVFQPAIGHTLDYGYDSVTGQGETIDYGSHWALTDSLDFLGLAVTVVLAVLFFVAAATSFVKDKAENAEEPNSRFFGLRIFLPIAYTGALLLLTGLESGTDDNPVFLNPLYYLYCALIGVAYVIFDMLRRRHIRMTWELGFSLSSGFLLALLFGCLRGWGLLPV